MKKLFATLINARSTVQTSTCSIMSSRSKSKSSKSSKNLSAVKSNSIPAIFDRVTFDIRVRPNAGRTFIEKVDVQSDSVFDLQMNVKEPPENNEANRAIIKYIAKLLSLSTDDVSLISGAKSKSKSFQVRNWNPAMIQTLQQNASS